MVSERNRIIELVEYLKTIGLDVNIAKNKARGNNGVFIRKNNTCRIDISKNVTKDNLLKTILHEYAHFLHYTMDKSLTSLDFVFDNYNNEITEELRNVTVNEIPKDFAQSLFKIKEETQGEINNLTKNFIKKFPNIKTSSLPPFIFMHPDLHIKYLELKQKKNFLKKINSKINRLNKYYNNNSELFARFVSLYFTDKSKANELAPTVSEIIEKNIIERKFPSLTHIAEILTKE